MLGMDLRDEGRRRAALDPPARRTAARRPVPHLRLEEVRCGARGRGAEAREGVVSAVKVPRPPAGLRSGERAHWRAVLSDYELDRQELILLTETCRVTNRLDRVPEAAADAPLTVVLNRTGDAVAQPLLVEAC